jgi:zinc protease
LFAARAALREFKHLVEHGMAPEAFTQTKRFLSKYVLNYAQTTMERLGYALDDKFYGIQESHLAKFRRMMGELKLRDVNAAIKKHWQVDKMKIVFVTKDGNALKETLVANAPSTITYKSPKPESILSEDKEISAFPIKVKESQVKILPGGELFLR